MLEFFLTYLKNAGKDVQTQLLQTLSIMLQNLKNNAYIYYMLSQNHLNSLITHKFDFQDEELVGLYISLVKTIALKLDAQTVQFDSSRLPVPSTYFPATQEMQSVASSLPVTSTYFPAAQSVQSPCE